MSDKPTAYPLTDFSVKQRMRPRPGSIGRQNGRPGGGFHERRGGVKIASVLSGVLGGVLGQVLGAALIFVNVIRFGDYRAIPSGSALFIFSWTGFFAALAGLRRPRASALIHLGAIVGLIVVALLARIWSLGVPIALLALSGGNALRAAWGMRPIVAS